MKNIICIVCPNGCRLKINDEGHVSGAKCKRGEAFAATELTAPTRTLTTTVKTVFEQLPVLPVRTQGEISKQLISRAVIELKSIVINKPIKCGDIVLENILNTGCNVIATASICI